MSLSQFQSPCEINKNFLIMLKFHEVLLLSKYLIHNQFKGHKDKFTNVNNSSGFEMQRRLDIKKPTTWNYLIFLDIMGPQRIQHL